MTKFLFGMFCAFLLYVAGWSLVERVLVTGGRMAISALERADSVAKEMVR